MSVSPKEYQQLHALFGRCAMAEDMEMLKAELYGYDPEKFYYFSPVAEPRMHISVIDLLTTFGPLFKRYIELNNNHKEEI